MSEHSAWRADQLYSSVICVKKKTESLFFFSLSLFSFQSWSHDALVRSILSSLSPRCCPLEVCGRSFLISQENRFEILKYGNKKKDAVVKRAPPKKSSFEHIIVQTRFLLTIFVLYTVISFISALYNIITTETAATKKQTLTLTCIASNDSLFVVFVSMRVWST